MNYIELRHQDPSAHTANITPMSLSLTCSTALEDSLHSAEHTRTIYQLMNQAKMLRMAEPRSLLMTLLSH